MKLDADTLFADTGIPAEVFQHAFVRAEVDFIINEACDLTTLGNCSSEEFENRSIRLPGEQVVNIRNAEGSQLRLLASQLTAAGLPIPATLASKLAAQGETV